jgi:hypothetical protein
MQMLWGRADVKSGRLIEPESFADRSWNRRECSTHQRKVGHDSRLSVKLGDRGASAQPGANLAFACSLGQGGQAGRQVSR